MKIAFVGDIGLFGKNSDAETADIEKRFRYVADILNKHDYVVGNLETPLTEHTKNIGGKSAYIKGISKDAEMLKKLGITHVSLANNHMYDFCKCGLTDTIKCLEDNGIQWFGIGGKSEYICNGANNLALHGYCCYSTNAKGLDERDMYVDRLDPGQMKKDLANDKKNGYFPIMSCHWGEEHVHYPNYDHVRLARKLAEYDGDMLIYGHHPHVIQGLEKINNTLIAYSLGNFCFDDVYTSRSDKPLIKLSRDNRETFILSVEIQDNHIKKYDIIPISFINEIYESDEAISEKINEWSKALNEKPEKYIGDRAEKLRNYINGRKANRDLRWYIKRLNYNSFKMIVSARKCKKEYDAMMKRIDESV